jgi:hypothetical protein
VGEQRRAAVEQQAIVDDDGPVVPLERKGRACSEERELQAMVTSFIR